MKLLLFFISIIYSLVFFVFYKLSNGLNILGDELDIYYKIDVLSTNLLYETIIFVLIGLFFFIYFSEKSSNNTKIKNFSISKENINSLVFLFIFSVILFIFVYYFNIIVYNKILLFNLIGLIFNISIYFFIIKLNFFKKLLKLLKIISIVSIYISSISGIYYLINYDINYIVLSTLIYSLMFNFYIHFKYSNLVSFIFAIFLSLFIFNYIGYIYF